MMDKELALIFEYANAPQELKEAATLHRSNSTKLTKKKASLDALSTEVTALQAEYDKSEKAFRVALKSWTPAGV